MNFPALGSEVGPRRCGPGVLKRRTPHIRDHLSARQPLINCLLNISIHRCSAGNTESGSQALELHDLNDTSTSIAFAPYSLFTIVLNLG